MSIYNFLWGNEVFFFVLFYFDLDFLRQGLYVALAVLELDM